MKLVRAIEQTFGKLQQPDLETLKTSLLSLGDLLDSVPDSRTEPSGLSYGRNVLLRTEDVEVIVIHIPAYEATAIHDHAASVGAAILVEGKLVNTSFELDPYGYPAALSDRIIREGECFFAPEGQIHQLSNPNPSRAISLHAYAPPLTNTQRYTPYSEVLDYVI